MGLSGLQQGGPSVVVVFWVSGSWEREVILRDLGGGGSLLCRGE